MAILLHVSIVRHYFGLVFTYVGVLYAMLVDINSQNLLVVLMGLQLWFVVVLAKNSTKFI